MERADGQLILFCANCDMGMIQFPPTDTSIFYRDGYYGGAGEGDVGYADYAFTAEHGLVWPRLMVQALASEGRVLDVGCADGFLLRRLGPSYELFGIEVNTHAAETARLNGVEILGHDVLLDIGGPQLRGFFDIVTAIATFEHVLDLRGAVGACLHSLKPGGALIFEIPLISDTRDNKDWLNASFEHIHYPTARGVSALLSSFAGYRSVGYESDIHGYSSTYVGALTSDPTTFERLEHLFECMRQANPDGLNEQELVLNLAYNVVHSFNVTPERVLGLPRLIEQCYSSALIQRLTQLWHADATAAANAAWYQSQAENWRSAFENLNLVYSVSANSAVSHQGGIHSDA